MFQSLWFLVIAFCSTALAGTALAQLTVPARPARPAGTSLELQDRDAVPGEVVHVGGHLPWRYRTEDLIVLDPGRNGLRAPPRGFSWIEIGSDFALVEDATYLVFQVVNRDGK
jgi:Ni/Co efflux regulator RcnB